MRKSLIGRLHQYLRLSHLLILQLVILSQLVWLPHLVTQPYLGWQPSPTSIHHLGSQPRFILASLPSAVITGVSHSWLNASAGVPAVPATISMSASENWSSKMFVKLLSGRSSDLDGHTKSVN